MRNNSPSGVAAIDLGSNSFHLVRADLIDDELHIRHRIKVPVQLANGLDHRSRLSDEAIQRGLAALEKFNEHLQDLPGSQIKAVATHTLRQAENSKDFIKPAQDILGTKLQIISGPEEGRITFQGVALNRQLERPTLLIDIGGGSTELVLGDGSGIKAVTSRSMGCVVFRDRYFDLETRPTSVQFAQARNEARNQIEVISSRFKKFEHVLGSSGTIKAISQVGAALEQGAVVTLASLELIQKSLCELEKSEFIACTGIAPERYSVLPAGVAILQGAFQQLELQSMEPTEAALREGLLAQFLPQGAISKVRKKTVKSLQKRFHVDIKQARRVRKTAERLIKLQGLVDDEIIQLMSEAARLHEVGKGINYSDHQQHGAYLLEHSDLPGFGRGDQNFISELVGAQRKKPPELADWSEQQKVALACLRLAILMHSARRDNSDIDVEFSSNRWTMRGVENWRIAEFKKECKRLQALGIQVMLEGDG